MVMLLFNSEQLFKSLCIHTIVFYNKSLEVLRLTGHVAQLCSGSVFLLYHIFLLYWYDDSQKLIPNRIKLFGVRLCLLSLVNSCV